MDANIILGLGLYTIIGVAPLIYNYYVVNKKHAEHSRKVEDIKASFHNKPNIPQTYRTLQTITPINKAIGTPPIIVFVLNKNNLKDPEIRKLVITYLTREKRKDEPTATVLGETPVELGVRDIAQAGIQAINTEGLAAMET